MRNKYFLTFFLIIFLFLLSSFCFARTLEVDYPALPTGETITPTTLLPGYIKYMFVFGMSIGFLAAFVSLIIGGFLYTISVASPGAKKEAKSRIFSAISGVVLLAIIYLIMTTINPQLSILYITGLKKIPEPPPPPPPAGVYFYKNKGCTSPSDEVLFGFSNISDLGELKNNIKSVKIVHNNPKELYYIAVLYDEWYYRSKCKYIDPNTECVNINPFTSSASIYEYDYSPEGGGVTFYRRSFYNNKGGWYKVENSEIGEIYVKELNDLEFKDVPKEEQDCVKWDFEEGDPEKNYCSEWEPQTLAGENITSIEIDGNYFVMLIYLDPENPSPEGGYSYSFCQAFSTEDDINKEGPKQIKWEYIRSQGKYLNYVLIFPVKEK